MNKRIILCFISILVLVPACKTAISEVTEQIESTETSLPTPETTIEFVVTFNGNGCVVEGPSEVLPGEYGFKFIDESDVRGELWLIYLDEGKTIQDLNDLQSEPGEWKPKPSWAHYGSKVSGKFEESDDGKVEISVWRLNKIREYTILCYVDSPRNIWHVAPIHVVETLSN